MAAITASSLHTCALTTEGGVKCWGSNGNGELGNGTTNGSSTPVDVATLESGVVAISAGGDHTCAVTTDGHVQCWGSNGSGELGFETEESCTFQYACSTTPAEVVGLEFAEALALGVNHTCALMAGGDVQCWGENPAGQLGDGTSDYDRHPIPVAVVGLEDGAAAVAAGGAHTCAVVSARGLTCWGWNMYGQLGDGSTSSRDTPADVVGLGAKVAGNVNCTGNANAIDALLLLQFDAGLLDSLACPENADVNQDGNINSIDAALVLQYGAGLLPRLPP